MSKQQNGTNGTITAKKCADKGKKMPDKIKVLVTDDNEINAMLAVELMNLFGLQADIASSGEEAVEHVRNDKYVFILMDHIMPGMDGVEATGKIHEISDIPVYAMTGDPSDEIISEFKAQGALGMISKPLNPKQIADIIKEHVPQGEYDIPDDLIKQLTTSKNRTETLFEKLAKDIEGLNYLEGLANSFNDEEQYIRTLKSVIANIRQYTQLLTDCNTPEGIAQLKFVAHSLKNVFANAGYDDLRNESGELEKLADVLIGQSEPGANFENQITDNLKQRIAEYPDKCLAAADRTQNLLDEYSRRTKPEDDKKEYYEKPEQPLNEIDLAEVYAYTIGALDRFEIDYICEGLEILKKALTGEDRKRIEAAIEAANSFDYDNVRKLINEATSLQMGRGEAR